MEPGIYEFAEFRIDAGKRVLFRNGQPVVLTPKVFDTLLYLVEHSGTLLEKDALMEAVWPNTVVEENNLNQNISTLRKVLGESRRENRFIATVPGRGYRFLAPVSRANNASEVERASKTLAAAQGTGFVSLRPNSVHGETPGITGVGRRWYRLLAVVVVIAAVAGTLLSREWGKRGTGHLAIETRITANPTEAPINAAVISPDGKYVVYEDPTGVYLRQIDTGESRPLPLPKDFSGIPSSWFPDGTHLLLTSRDKTEQKATIWKVSILGGTPQMLLEGAEEGAVSPDGSLIAFFHRSTAALYGLRGNPIFHTVGELWLAGSDGQNPRKFVVPAEVNDSHSVGTEVTAVSWAPDGRRVAYIERHKAVAHTRSGDQSWLLTREVAGGEAQLILRERRIAPTNLCWSRDGRLLYAMRADPKNPRGDYGVEAVRIDAKTGSANGEPEPVSNGQGWIGGLSVTADGKRLLLWRGNSLPQVFVSEFDRATHRFATPRRLTLDENANEPSSWTPDSKSVFFLSDRGGAWKLFRQRVDQTIAEVAVASQNIQATLPRLSADGAEILFADVGGTEDPSAPVHVMAMPLSGGVPRQILEDVGIDGFFCARSPATACVYDKAVGSTTVFIAFDTQKGRRREIATFSGWPSWGLSPDGSQLAVVTDGHQGRIQLISLEAGTRRDVVVKDWPVLRGAYWAADGRSVLIRSVTPNGTTVILDIDLKGNAHVALKSDLHAQVLWVIPSPDGRYAALDVITGENNVWKIENF